MKILRLLFSVIALSIIIVQKVYSIPLADSVSVNNEETKKLHHAGWAFSYAAGTASSGLEAMMISSMYSYSVESWWDIEASIHYLGRSIRSDFIGPLRTYNSSWTIDGTFMFTPFSHGERNAIRLGIGPSIQILQRISNIKDLSNPPIEQVLYGNVTIIGGTFKAEYQISLSAEMDAGVRGQLNVYAQEYLGIRPLVSSEQRVVLGGIGIFIRFNW
jgi:hypothetical protein